MAERGALPEVEMHEDEHFQTRAGRLGREAEERAEQSLLAAGFRIVDRNLRLLGSGLTVNLVVADARGREWYVDVVGASTGPRPGLRRTDSSWKAIGRLTVLKALDRTPRLLLTSHLPLAGSAGDCALRQVGPSLCLDILCFDDPDDLAQLHRYAERGPTGQAGRFWRG